jgi:hypothetical protein
MWWSGLNGAEVKAGLAAVSDQLGRERIGGQEYYFDPALPQDVRDQPPAFLLPPFDEFLVAYRDRSAVLDPERNNLIVPGGNGIFNPIIVADGRVVGTWKRELKKDRVALSLSAFDPLSKAQAKAVDDVARRYAGFLGKREHSATV